MTNCFKLVDAPNWVADDAQRYFYALPRIVVDHNKA